MKRQGRILLTTATAASLALCMATGVLWMRSYRTPASLYGVTFHGVRYTVHSAAGQLTLMHHRLPYRMMGPSGRSRHDSAVKTCCAIFAHPIKTRACGR